MRAALRPWALSIFVADLLGGASGGDVLERKWRHDDEERGGEAEKKASQICGRQAFLGSGSRGVGIGDLWHRRQVPPAIRSVAPEAATVVRSIGAVNPDPA